MPRIVPGTSGVPPNADIGIYSFGEKGNVFPRVQFEWDCRSLRDPTGQKQFAALTGAHDSVKSWVKEDERVATIISCCRLIANDLIKPKARTTTGTTEIVQISKWLSFSFKDFHGKWSAPAMAELVADALDLDGYKVTVVHYGLPANK